MSAPPHLLHVFATFAAAGPQMRTVALIDACGDEYRHTVLAMDGDVSAHVHLARPSDTRLVDAPPRAGTLATVRAFRRLLARERPDALLTYNWGAIEAALAARTRGAGRRHLHHEDGFRPDEVHGLKLRRNLFRRVALGGSRAVVVVSHGLRESARRAWGVAEERLHLVPNGIRAERYSARDGNPALRAELGVPRDALLVGWVGHLRPEKNPRRLVAALSGLGDEPVHALVLGDGPERAAVERDAAAAGLAGRLHLVGFRADPRPYYAAMDVLALSSDTEQMPLALLEAMASSLPVAATDVGDVARMLPPGQGSFVVPLAAPGGAEEPAAAGLGRALAALLTDGALRRRLGRGNRERVEERYSFGAMLARYRELYAELVGSP